jgi:hypothetical protein
MKRFKQVIIGVMAYAAAFVIGLALCRAGYQRWQLNDIPVMSFLSGLLLFGVVQSFFSLVFLAVLIHELNHCVASFVTGGKVSGIQASVDQGGVAVVSKGGVFVDLAPYCVPLLAVIFALLSFITVEWLRPFMLMLTGAALSFHVYSTMRSLKQKQTDVQAYPFIFWSGVVLLVNTLFILVISWGLLPGVIRMADVWKNILRIFG